MFEFQDLKILTEVANQQSITKAADKLGYVQPNITSRIKKLERQTECPLFIRDKRGMKLTPNGKTLLNYAKKIVSLCDEAEQTIKGLAYPNGELNIGSMETTAYVRLPEVLYRYRRKFPDVDINLHTGPTEMLVEKVLTHELDSAFVASSVNHPELCGNNVVKERLVLISNSLENPLKKDNCTLLAFENGCFYRSILKKIMQDYHIKVDKIIEVDSPQAILNFVERGLGNSLIPESMAKLNDGVYTHVINEEYTHVDTMLIRRKNAALTPSLMNFINMSKDMDLEPDLLKTVNIK